MKILLAIIVLTAAVAAPAGAAGVPQTDASSDAQTELAETCS